MVVHLLLHLNLLHGVSRVVSQMVKEGCSYVFMEVSSHALDQNRVSYRIIG
ncbi:Mur ligase family protein [bacterium]|nr:Mur ligase family protein [bacterium]